MTNQVQLMVEKVLHAQKSTNIIMEEKHNSRNLRGRIKLKLHRVESRLQNRVT